MKKLFFTALVAVVAIGGAFAGSGKATLVNAGILGGTVCNIPVNCAPNQPIPCRIDPLDPTSDQLYLIDTQQPVGKCTTYLGFN